MPNHSQSSESLTYSSGESTSHALETGTHDGRIDTLTQLISQHTQTLRDCERRRTELILLERGYRGYTSMSKTPPEVWAEIFRFASASFLYHPRSPAKTIPDDWDSLLPHNPVSTIENVCADWRKTVRSIPELWSSLLLKESCREVPEELKRKESRIHKTLLRNLSTALHHSRDTPLHITICLQDEDMDDDYMDYSVSKEFVEKAVKILINHRQRWSRLDIYDCNAAYASKILNDRIYRIPDNHIEAFPLLEELSFGWWQWFEEHDIPPVPFPHLRDTPRLRRVNFEGRCSDEYKFPWKQLQRVNFIAIPPQDYYRNVDSLVGATEIIMSEDSQHLLSPHTPNSPAMVSGYTLPFLETLSIRSWWDGRYYQAASFPNLRNLSIDWADEDDLADLANAVKIFGCVLHHFKCGLSSRSSRLTTVVLDVLSSLPCLQTLDLPYDNSSLTQNQAIEDDLIVLLRYLMKRSRTGFLTHCPDLQSLYVDPAYFTEPWLLATTISMIRMRWTPGLPDDVHSQGGLRRVGYVDRQIWDNSHELPSELSEPYEKLKEMERQGLEICFFKPKDE